jgi:beta-N-acetylhexosaminidase
LALVAFALLLLMGPAVADDKPAKVDIRGKLTDVKVVPGGLTVGVVLVEGTKEKDTSYDKASVRVIVMTKIEKVDGKKRKAAKWVDLKKGCKVEVVFDGPVAQSLPVKADAKSILILEDPK